MEEVVDVILESRGLMVGRLVGARACIDQLSGHGDGLIEKANGQQLARVVLLDPLQGGLQLT